MSKINLKLAHQEKIRLLAEKDPKGIYKIWHDKGERKIIRKIFEGNKIVFKRIPSVIRMPFPLPTIVSLPYSAFTRCKSFTSSKKTIKYGNITVYGSANIDLESLLPRIEIIQHMRDKNLPLVEEVQIIENILGGDFYLNIDREKTYLYEVEEYMPKKR